MRVNGGNSHDSLKEASSECQNDGGGEIVGILKKIKDADPADSHHASLRRSEETRHVKQDLVTVTILTNLRQGEAVVLEEVVLLTVTIVTNSRWSEAEEKEKVATETESATRESVVLVPDPIVSAPWSVLIGRGDPCDSCRDTAHVVVSCLTCHKSTGRAALAMRWTA